MSAIPDEGSTQTASNPQEEAFLRRREAREAARQENVSRRKKEAPDDTNDSVSEFLAEFSTKKEAIEVLVEVKVEDGALAEHRAEIGRQMQALRLLLNEATLFLPSYEARASEQTMSELESRIKEKLDAAAPKAAFSFSARRKKKEKEKKKVEPVPKADSTTAAVVAPSAHVPDAGSIVDNLSDKTIVLGPEQLDGRDFNLCRLTRCKVYLCGPMTALRLVDLTDCEVFVGPVGGSCFIDQCVGCSLTLSCHQLRMHTSEDCSLYLHVTSKPIIEHCTGIAVAPYSFEYPCIDDHMQTARLDASKNLWAEVNDFRWLKSQHSPNWRVLPDDDRRPPVALLEADVAALKESSTPL